MGLLIAVAIGFVAVLIAIGLTGPTVQLLRSLPSLFISAWHKRGLLSSVPLENWLVFPFVLAFVLAGGWYWIAYDEWKGTRPTRGRRVLSGDEARRTAAQNVDKVRPRSGPKRRPF